MLPPEKNHFRSRPGRPGTLAHRQAQRHDRPGQKDKESSQQCTLDGLAFSCFGSTWRIIPATVSGWCAPSMMTGEPGPPPNITPPRNSRPYDQGLWKPLVSLNKALSNPNFWGGSLEDHHRTRKWLGSLPFISHKKAIWKGNKPILRGLTITMVINHVSKSWDDPPSRMLAPHHQDDVHDIFSNSGIPN